MTKDEKRAAVDLEDQAISIFLREHADGEPTAPVWNNLHADEREFWLDRARKENEVDPETVRARELYDARMGDSDHEPFDDLPQDEIELWVEEARRNPPTARTQIKRGLNLRTLPPYAMDAIEATGIDPRTHHRGEHAAFEKEMSGIVKAVRLLARQSPEDAQIRKELLEAGLTPHNSELHPVQGTIIVSGEDA